MQRCAQTCARNTKEIIAAGADRVSASEQLTKIDPSIARLIDHTILKPDATRADIVKICREARQYGFASVCVNPYWVPLVRAGTAGIAGQGLHGGGISAGRHQHRGQGCGDGRGACALARRKSTWSSTSGRCARAINEAVQAGYSGRW